MRMTRQRKVILEELRRMNTHPGADEIHWNPGWVESTPERELAAVRTLDNPAGEESLDHARRAAALAMAVSSRPPS